MYITTEGVKSEKTIVGFCQLAYQDLILTAQIGGHLKNHNAGNRRAFVEKVGYQISKK